MSKEIWTEKAVLRKIVSDLDDLIASSEGVAGLHRNGDIAPWEELTEGGQFESWLSSLEVARGVLEQTQVLPSPTYTIEQVESAIRGVIESCYGDFVNRTHANRSEMETFILTITKRLSQQGGEKG